MACLDHECGRCGHAWMDNTKARWCPQCNHWGVTNVFDEPLSDHVDRDDRADEEDRYLGDVDGDDA